MQNSYDVAFPILRDLGIKATLFVVSGVFTGEVGTEQVRPNDHSPLMSYEQVQELYKAGWEIGSHSHTHRVFDTLNEHDVYDELTRSKELLTEFEPVSFAFPAGHNHWTPEQGNLALTVYDHVRNVANEPKREGRIVDAYPVDNYPTTELKGERVYTCHHRVLMPEAFRRWVTSLKAEGVQFLRMKDL